MYWQVIAIWVAGLNGVFAMADGHQAQSRRILFYEPAVSSLTGTIEIQTFPGPPNWESIAKGDEIERGWYLRLDRPIDVMPGPDSNIANTEPEKDVRIVQIAIGNDHIWKELHDGRRCELRGPLFHRLTGHHHARVLIHADAFVPPLAGDKQ
jgi:hypothetical protein